MILVSNFNMYVGGGEVIALDFCRHLKIKGYSYKLLCLKGSFIEKTAVEEHLEFLCVDEKFSSLIFSKTHIHSELARIVNDAIKSDSISILTITFRDLYNTISILPYLRSQIRICHYILHPEDYKYGLSLRILNRKKHIDFNLNLINILNNSSCLVLPNPNAGRGIKNYYNPYIPFYVENLGFRENVKSKENDLNQINIITISRFVDFKIASIVGIMIHTLFRKNINLTVVGYGKWYILLLIISFFSPKRIKLIGKCSKSELVQKIKQHDVLYAQGTTLILGISLGLPCLISHYSRWYDWIFSRIGSVGWYTYEKKFDFGDYRIKNYNKSIHSFKNYLNREEIIKASMNENDKLLSEFNKDYVLENLNSILNGPPNSNELKNIVLPKPTLIKSFLYQFKKW